MLLNLEWVANPSNRRAAVRYLRLHVALAHYLQQVPQERDLALSRQQAHEGGVGRLLVWG